MLRQFKLASDIILGLGSDHNTTNYDNTFDIFLGKPFWIWPSHEDTNECCFNHIICLPVKNNQEYPIFDYEKLIYDAIENNQNIWIKKSRGIGVTTFLIR